MISLDAAVILGGLLFVMWAYLKPLPNDWPWRERVWRVWLMWGTDIWRGWRAIVVAALWAWWIGERLPLRETVEVRTVEVPVQFGLWPRGKEMIYAARNGQQFQALYAGEKGWYYRAGAGRWRHLVTNVPYNPESGAEETVAVRSGGGED